MNTDPCEQIRERFPTARNIRIQFELPQRDREKPRTLMVEIEESDSDRYRATMKNMDNEFETTFPTKRENTWDDILTEIAIHAGT